MRYQMTPRKSYYRIEEQMPKNESFEGVVVVVVYNYGTNHRNSMTTYYHDDFVVEMMTDVAWSVVSRAMMIHVVVVAVVAAVAVDDVSLVHLMYYSHQSMT